MARYTGPKHKLARREGVNILEKSSSSLERRLNIPPGQHGSKGKRKMSDFNVRLREKQKAKRIYGVLERQFQRYFRQATKAKATTGERLLQILESRLDNLIYRLRFVPTRFMARQLVTHGHVLVDGKRVNIPSYGVRPGEVIILRPKAMEIPVVKKLLAEKNINLVPYIERKGAAGKIVKIPSREEIPVDVDEQLIVEYYSR